MCNTRGHVLLQKTQKLLLTIICWFSTWQTKTLFFLTSVYYFTHLSLQTESDYSKYSSSSITLWTHLWLSSLAVVCLPQVPMVERSAPRRRSCSLSDDYTFTPESPPSCSPQNFSSSTSSSSLSFWRHLASLTSHYCLLLDTILLDPLLLLSTSRIPAGCLVYCSGPFPTSYIL